MLLVDDDPDLVELTAERLERQDDAVTTVVETSPAAALDRLQETEVDAVISDYDMPGMNGLELLEAVRDEFPALPFVLFTGKGSEEIASEAISAGVTDYLQKQPGREQYELLADRIRNAVSNRHAHRALADQEAWYRGLIEASIDILTVLGRDSTFEYLSPSCETLLGYEPEALVGEVAFERIHPDDRGYVREQFERLETSEDETEIAEFRFRTADGEWKWLEARSINRLDDPVVEGIVVNVRDIDDRKAHERELERYETIVETVGDGVYMLDEDGRFASVNDYVVRQTGYDRDELVGEPVSKLLADEDVETGTALIEELLSTPDKRIAAHEVTVETADGETLDVELRIALLPTEDGEYRGTVGIARDITERKQREQELERYETIVETVADGVYALDEQGRYTYVNSYIEEVTGYDREEIIGEPASSFIADDDVERFEQALGEMLTGDRESAVFEIELPTTTDETLPVEARITLLSSDGEFRGSAGVLRDISGRKERERTLERQNERLEEFASVVSHDLRNPLNVAKGQVDLARGERESEHLATAAEALDRMDHLITDLLQLARQGKVVQEFERISLETATADAWAQVAAEDAHLDAEDVTVRADPDRLVQLFQNLFENAVEHGGSDVTIRVGPLEERAGFYVEDDGAGIAPAERERILDRGYSTSDEQTGFGLAIVTEIVDAHDWHVEVTESSGGGARFEIRDVEEVDS